MGRSKKSGQGFWRELLVVVLVPVVQEGMRYLAARWFAGRSDSGGGLDFLGAKPLSRRK